MYKILHIPTNKIIKYQYEFYEYIRLSDNFNERFASEAQFIFYVSAYCRLLLYAIENKKHRLEFIILKVTK